MIFMKRINNSSIATKIGILSVSSCLLILAVFFFIDNRKNTQIEKVISDYGKDLKETVFISSFQLLRGGNMEGFQSVLEKAAEIEDITEFSLLGPDGQTRYSSDSSMVGTSDNLAVGLTADIQTENGALSTFYHPVITTEYCTQCHDEWQEGSVNSIYRITLDSQRVDSIERASTRMSAFAAVMMLALIPLFLIFAKKIFINPVMWISREADKLAEGDIELSEEDRLESEKLIGRGDEIGRVGRSFIKLVEVLGDKAQAAEEIGRGNLNTEVKVISERDKLGKAMLRMVESLRTMNTEVGQLTRAALDGKLDTRADASAFEGDYGKMVDGINELLDAIVKPIQESAEVLAAAAHKDLTRRVSGQYMGQLNELKENINSTVSSLDDALRQVSEAVEQVGSASSQIATGNQALAQGASHQASSLEEFSSSLEEMSSMTTQNAANAERAKEMSLSARAAADSGHKAMENMTQAIDRIKTSSSETAKVVKTIDEIAFQTNLLALNAAVEAARAGEAGKGFAVVAEEVRNLALRSAEAAKSTAELIKEAVDNAESGVVITEEVGGSLKEIIENNNEVADLISQISTAAGEQALGINQLNESVADMDQITQQNASNSEEGASVAEELNGQVAELRAMVDGFSLTGLGGGRKPESVMSVPMVEAAPNKPVNRLKNHKGNGSG